MSKLAAAMGQSAGNAAGRERTPYEVFRAQIEKLRPEIATMTGKEGVDRFIRVCLNAVQSNPGVLVADRKSLIISCLRAAQDRLLPDGREAVLNIYKTKVRQDGIEQWKELVQYLPMVGGLIKKLYDSGHVIFVDAVAVRERDDFEYQRGDEPRIVHKPYVGEEDPGKVIAAYVVAKLKNGETKREVMSRRDIEIVRNASKAPNGLMWDKFYDQGAIKSVIKRAYKQIPNYYELDSVIAADNEATGMDVEGTVVSSSTDLTALVDGRMDQELSRVPTGAPASAPKEEVNVDATTEPEKKIEPVKEQKNEADRPAKPVGKSPGTSEVKGTIIAKMKACEDLDALAIIADDSNAFEWKPADLGEINTVYHDRVAVLTA